MGSRVSLPSSGRASPPGPAADTGQREVATGGLFPAVLEGVGGRGCVSPPRQAFAAHALAAPPSLVSGLSPLLGSAAQSYAGLDRGPRPQRPRSYSATPSIPLCLQLRFTAVRQAEGKWLNRYGPPKWAAQGGRRGRIGRDVEREKRERGLERCRESGDGSSIQAGPRTRKDGE